MSTVACDISDRFWAKVDRSAECWMWTGARSGRYGRSWDGTQVTTAHRVAYTLAKGPIPAGLQIDHLCRNTFCVNPDHLEAVTQRVNLRRQGLVGAAATHAAKQECPRCGDPFTVRARGRFCRRCATESNRRYRDRRRAEGTWRR